MSEPEQKTDFLKAAMCLIRYSDFLKKIEDGTLSQERPERMGNNIAVINTAAAKKVHEQKYNTHIEDFFDCLKNENDAFMIIPGTDYSLFHFACSLGLEDILDPLLSSQTPENQTAEFWGSAYALAFGKYHSSTAYDNDGMMHMIVRTLKSHMKNAINIERDKRLADLRPKIN